MLSGRAAVVLIEENDWVVLPHSDGEAEDRVEDLHWLTYSI